MNEKTNCPTSVTISMYDNLDTTSINAGLKNTSLLCVFLMVCDTSRFRWFITLEKLLSTNIAIPLFYCYYF